MATCFTSGKEGAGGKEGESRREVTEPEAVLAVHGRVGVGGSRGKSNSVHMGVPEGGRGQVIVSSLMVLLRTSSTVSAVLVLAVFASAGLVHV